MSSYAATSPKSISIKKAAETAAAGKKKKVNVKPYLFLAPAMLALIWWVYKPLFGTLRYSFYDWGMVPGTQAVFNGLATKIKLVAKN